MLALQGLDLYLQGRGGINGPDEGQRLGRLDGGCEQLRRVGAKVGRVDRLAGCLQQVHSACRSDESSLQAYFWGRIL